MESRSGRIARQLTQWVGGTIILLMLAFVVLDLGLQTARFRKYHYRVAARGAEGLKQLLWSRRGMEEALQSLREIDVGINYVEGPRRGFAVFDLDGRLLFATLLARSTEGDETAALFRLPPEDDVESFRYRISGTNVAVAATRFRTRSETPDEGVAVYLVDVTDLSQATMFLWGWRSVIILLMVIGVMFAVRVPVRAFVLKPMEGLFVAAYAASKDDFRELPRCPVDNEFADLYEMFDRLMSHLSDTRIVEATLVEEDDRDQPEGTA